MAQGEVSDYNIGDTQATWVQSLGGEDPLEKKMAVFLSGKSYRQRTLAGYSPWGCKELNTTEYFLYTRTHACMHALTHTHKDL